MHFQACARSPHMSLKTSLNLSCMIGVLLLFLALLESVESPPPGPPPPPVCMTCSDSETTCKKFARNCRSLRDKDEMNQKLHDQCSGSLSPIRCQTYAVRFDNKWEVERGCWNFYESACFERTFGIQVPIPAIPPTGRFCAEVDTDYVGYAQYLRCLHSKNVKPFKYGLPAISILEEMGDFHEGKPFRLKYCICENDKCNKLLP